MVKAYKLFLFVLEAEWNGLKGELFYVMFYNSRYCLFAALLGFCEVFLYGLRVTDDEYYDVCIYCIF